MTHTPKNFWTNKKNDNQEILTNKHPGHQQRHLEAPQQTSNRISPSINYGKNQDRISQELTNSDA